MTGRDHAAGTPRFPEPLFVGRPNVPSLDELLPMLGDALASRWLSNDGPLVRALEEELADTLGTSYCAVTCSGTAAIDLIMDLLPPGPVALPAFTFLGTARALEWRGRPVAFLDVSRDTHLVDPADLLRDVGVRLAAVMCVDIWGQPSPTDALVRAMRSHEVPLIIDAAQSLGAVRESTRGCMAIVGSLHATKIVNAGEGGYVATDDEAVFRAVCERRNFGFAGGDEPAGRGTNAKMSEINAALGLASLRQLGVALEANHANLEAYRDAFGRDQRIRLVSDSFVPGANHHYVVVEVPPALRDPAVRALHAENVVARRYFSPGCHRVGIEPAVVRELPVTDAIVDRVLALPTGTAVTPATAERVGRLVVDVLDRIAEGR